ncbi:hypothetical protein ACH4OW_26760 [Streptomyces sp. NPDC017056]|uniref:hypothetical protein n=1 Tax=Streptomyces sp. NPDC017056 TaxID=3364973 RepID=UPI003798B221
MSSPSYDLALGMSQDSLTSGIKEMHKKHHAALFKGDETVPKDKKEYRFIWDADEAPNLVLDAPDKTVWDNTWKAQGVTALPASNVVQLVLPNLIANCSIDNIALPQVKGEVIIPAHVTVESGAVTLKLLGVWMKNPPGNGTDKILMKNVVVPKIMKMANPPLKGLQLPAQRLMDKEVKLKPVVVDVVTKTQLVIAATATVSLSAEDFQDTYSWPTGKKVFLLISPAVLEKLIEPMVTKYKNKLLIDAKEGDWSYNATLKAWLKEITNVKISEKNPQQGSAKVNIPWEANGYIMGHEDSGCSIFKASQKA